MGVERARLVIYREGTISGVINGVKPEEHAQVVLAAMKEAKWIQVSSGARDPYRIGRSVDRVIGPSVSIAHYLYVSLGQFLSALRVLGSQMTRSPDDPITRSGSLATLGRLDKATSTR